MEGMAGVLEDCPYEGSDEASETELLDRSLSVWRGWSSTKLSSDDDQFTPVNLDIYTASSIGLYDCVCNFIKRGDVDLNRKNLGGWTALMYACYIGHDNVVNLLLDAGVNVNVRNNKGQTPLMLASSCGNESVAYFLLQQDADLEARDVKGWTALFHATYSGHQNMVNFLLDNNSNMETKEPMRGMTPFMEAAAAGHEIIVHHFLQHQVDLNAKCHSGDTARSLALVNGHTKIVSLIDNHLLGPSYPLRAEPGLHLDELSSSDEALNRPRARHRNSRAKEKGPSIREGPEAFAKLIDNRAKGQKKSDTAVSSVSHHSHRPYVPHGYVSFDQHYTQHEVSGDETTSRDMISPIQPEDHVSSESNRDMSGDIEEDTDAFSQTGALTIKSSSSSSGGLVAALGLSQQHATSSSDESSPPKHTYSNTVSYEGVSMSSQQVNTGGPLQNSDVYNEMRVSEQHQTRSEKVTGQGQMTVAVSHDLHNVNSHNQIQNTKPLSANPSTPQSQYTWHNKNTKILLKPESGVSVVGNLNEAVESGGGRLSEAAVLEQQQILMSRQKTTLPDILEPLGLLKYLSVFEEQDVDLQVFLTLTDNDLKEVGIKLFGPRRKMTNAIARWHSNARPASNDLEQAYTDKLEAEMQELAIQLHQSYEQLEQARRQVLQEQELRSVAEGCLTEDRMFLHSVQSMAADCQQNCNSALQLINSLSQAHQELCRRLESSSLHPTPSSSEDSLASAIREGLKLDEPKQYKRSDSHSDIRNLPTSHLLRATASIHQELQSQVAMATLLASKMTICEETPMSAKNNPNDIYD